MKCCGRVVGYYAHTSVLRYLAFTRQTLTRVLLPVSSPRCRSNLTRGVGRFREILRAVENRTTQSLRMVRDEGMFIYHLLQSSPLA